MRAELRIDSYDVAIDPSVNSDSFTPQYALHLDEDAPLYPIATRLYLKGTSIHPDAHLGHRYEIRNVRKDSQSPELRMKLRNVNAKDMFGAHRYRSYRGRHISV